MRHHIARASRVSLRFDLPALPAYPGAHEAWSDGATPGGAERNESYLADLVDWGEASPFQRALVVDPQTSGGLLLAVPPRNVAEYLSRVPEATVIGQVIPPGDRPIVLS